MEKPQAFDEEVLKLVKNELENLACSTLDLEVEVAVGPNWDYDYGQRRILYPLEGPLGVVEAPKRAFLGALFHEVAHAKYTDFGAVAEWPGDRVAYMRLLHCLEDLRVEARLRRHYPGVRDHFRALAHHSEGQGARRRLTTAPDHLNVLHNIGRHFDGLDLHFSSPRAAAFFRAKIGVVTRLADHDSTAALAVEVLAELWPAYERLFWASGGLEPLRVPMLLGKESGDLHAHHHECKDPESCKRCQKEKKKGETRETKPTDKPGCGGDAEAKAKLGGGLMAGGDQASADSGDEAGYQLSFSTVNPGLRRQPSRKENSSLYSEFERKLVQGMVSEEGMPDVDSRYEGSERFPTFERLFTPALRRQKVSLVRKMRSVLRDNDSRRPGGAFSEGALETSLLYKWKCNSNRVFSQRVMRSYPKYAISLLIDESSSMRGDRITHTAEAAVLLSEVLHTVRIPFQVIGFNSGVYVYKRFEDTYGWRIRRSLEEIMPEAESWRAENTNDAGAVAIAAHQSRRQDSENIMIVLTDGRSNLPNASIPGEFRDCFPRSARNFSQLTIETEIRKAMKHNLVIGIGINYEGVKELYPVSFVNRDIQELSGQMFNILQKHMKRV